MKIQSLIKIIFLLLNHWVVAKEEVASSSTPSGGDQSRITIKNSIVYHVVKNVKAIESDIFVSRKIDISPMLNGISTIHQTKDKVDMLCKQIPAIIGQVRFNADAKRRNEPRFKYLSTVGSLSHTEARKKCEALDMILPEVYTSVDYQHVKKFFGDKQVTHAHAGIYFDQEYSIQRFYSTGLPSWQAYQHILYTYKLPQLEIDDWGLVQGKTDARFFYTAQGDLVTYYETVPETKDYFRHKAYRKYYKKFDEFVAPVICQVKGRGYEIESVMAHKSPPTGWTYTRFPLSKQAVTSRKDRLRRSVKVTIPNGTIEVSPLEQYCVNVFNHMNEFSERSNVRMVDLLALVDISISNQPRSTFKRTVASEESTYNKTFDSTVGSKKNNTRTRRGIIPYLLLQGVRSVWGLMGFIEKIRTNRRLNKLEEAVEAQKDQVDALSKEVAKHSIAIEQLQISTQELNQRVEELTTKVNNLEQRMGALETEVKLFQILEFIDGLVVRAEESMNYGFNKLESIIHMSLVGQTSAFLLPPDKLQEVQDQLNKDSTAIIDSEYRHMKSIIVIDPDKGNSMLLAVVNIVALSRKSKELVKLMPMPSYQDYTTLVPVLDYNAVVLDQEAGTFTVIEPEELPNCLNEHCITSNPEINIAATSCGIPQLFDRHPTTCSFEEIVSDGIFLKRMQLDGIVFNVKEQVTAQIFCNAQGQSKAYKIKGAGIVNLPPGCVFSVTDKNGRIMKIKSLPIAQMIEFKQVDLIIAGPNEIFHQYHNSQLANGTSGLTKLINAHLSSLSEQLDGTSDLMKTQGRFVVILASLLGVTLLICIIIGALLFHYSTRFRRKVLTIKQELREGLENAATKFNLIEQKARDKTNDEFAASFPKVQHKNPPPVPPHNIKTLLKRMEQLEQQIAQSEGYLDLPSGKSESIYQNEEVEKHYSAPPSSGFRIYPITRLQEEIELQKKLLQPPQSQDSEGPVPLPRKK